MARRYKKRKPVRRIAVVGDGVTEKIYFEQLKGLEGINHVVIKPELPSKTSKGGSYRKVINTAKSLVEDGYDHVYCLIDFDTVLSENKLADFRKELKEITSEITVYINNPCFETWVLGHFERTGRAFENCGTVSRAIVKHLNGYCKEQKYLCGKNLYKTLKPYLESSAIPNAEFLEKNREGKSDNYPRAQVFKFFQEEKIVGPKRK